MRDTHLKIVQGTPFRLLVRVNIRNEEGVLVPMPLNDCVIRLQARPHLLSPQLFLDLSSNSTGITIDEEAGIFIIDLSSKKTSDLKIKYTNRLRAVYQCEIEKPNGDVYRILTGTITLFPEVIR